MGPREKRDPTGARPKQGPRAPKAMPPTAELASGLSNRSWDQNASRLGGAAPPSFRSLLKAAGNRAVTALLRVQPSLRVGSADDPAEREAEAVAEEVVRHIRG